MKKIHHIASKTIFMHAKKSLVLTIKIKNTIKYEVRDHCHYKGKYRGAVHNICNLRYKTLKEFPALFYNSSKYNYHCIIEELAEEFEGQFERLGENTEYIRLFLY